MKFGDFRRNFGQRPLFVPAYGVENYVDMAQAMHERLSAHGFVVVGTQDLAALGRKAAPSAPNRAKPKTDDTTYPDQPATTPRFNRNLKFFSTWFFEGNSTWRRPTLPRLTSGSTSC